MDEFRDEAVAVKAALNENPELFKLMSHPKIVKEEKVKIVEDIFAEKISAEFVGLLRLIVEKGHFAKVRLFLVCNSAFYIPLAFVNIVRFLIQGMGYSKFAILAGVFEMAARTLVGFVFVPMFGYPAACFASPVAWIFADCFLFPAYFHVLKKTKKMLSEPVRTSVA